MGVDEITSKSLVQIENIRVQWRCHRHKSPPKLPFIETLGSTLAARSGPTAVPLAYSHSQDDALSCENARTAL